MIADPAKMTDVTAEKWLKGITYHMLADVFVQNMISRTSFLKKKMESWVRSKNEWTGRAG